MIEQFFGITDTGKERQNNEDTFIAQQGADKRFIIACVIDGVGGYAGGEVAAKLAREAILRRLEKPEGEIISMLIDCFELANDSIIQEKQRNREYEQMSCVSTLAIADIFNNQFYYAHVGDTRLYLLRDQSLVKISHDQSFVGFLEESGRLSEDEAMSHPKRNEINKALGFESHLAKNTDYIETGQSPFLSGDVLLLCSDGLTDMVNSSEIANILLAKESSLKEKGQQLIDTANHNGGKDNVTVVLVYNDKIPVKHSATNIKQRSAVINNPKDNITEQPARDAELNLPAYKSNKTAITIVSILMLIFLGTSIYFFLTGKGIQEQKQPVVVVKDRTNPQEIKLQRAIDSVKGNILILSDTSYTTPIVITRTIQINRDSLLIKAKGRIILQSDSGYKGAAFSLTAKCKNIVVDSLSFNDFNVGISLTNNNLELKNVRFVNCEQSVQSKFIFTDKKYTNGKLPAVVLKSDSLPVIKK